MAWETSWRAVSKPGPAGLGERAKLVSERLKSPLQLIQGPVA